MSFLTGSSTHSWEPVVTVNTTAQSYWLNWRVLLCSIWLLMSVIFASILISRHESRLHSENGSREKQEEEPAAGLVYEDEVWKPCLKVIHPAWLLAYRVAAFFVLLILLILNADVDGATIFYFYTQWTFTLITIYFGLGSLLSIYGCYQYQNKVGGDGIDSGDLEAGEGTFAATTNASDDGAKHLELNQDCRDRQLAGFWGHVFQIIFQMNAGAVILTDSVFWFVIVPFLEIKDYSLNFLNISMHTVNAVFLLGDTYLNCMRFPWFRIAYFLLWTVFYVIFQWIVHACVSLWWPYRFLELSSSFAPLWYFSVGLMHIPCFAVFAMVIKMKHSLLSKHFPHSYQCVRS